MNLTVNFDDLENDLPFGPGQLQKPKPVFKESCSKCGGTGRYNGPSSHGRHCFKCGGVGYLEYSQPLAVRIQRKERKIQRKQEAIHENLEDWKKEHPTEFNWLRETDTSFAISLSQALHKYGSLTPGQLSAIQKCILSAQDRLIKREEAKAQQEAQAVTVSILKVETALQTGKSRGIRHPRLTLDHFTFSLASSSGRNPGAVYVKKGRDGGYLGKVMGGKFYRSRDCNEELERGILEAAEDPEKAATAYGLRTGVCAICRRTLTRGESIDRGIGPICAEKLGW